MTAETDHDAEARLAFEAQVRLSPMMEKAKALAQRNGGKLWRHPGGFW